LRIQPECVATMTSKKAVFLKVSYLF